MSHCELVLLGTSSQRPTRSRNHNGYLLRFGGISLLVDPGEGTQRQFTFAGASSSGLARILLTHLHGDHALGLPGMLQRLALHGREHAIPVHFPVSGRPYVERLCDSTIAEHVAVEFRPVPEPGGVVEHSPLRITALPLAHRVPAVGWRIEEPERVRFNSGRLRDLGLAGPEVGRLWTEGSLRRGDRTITLDEVTEVRPGRSAAVIMDTAMCENAVQLCDDVDLAIIEATYLSSEAHLAEQYAHLTAAQAGEIARDAGARKLVLTHFSSRYPDASGHLAEVADIFPDAIAAEDLMRVPFP